MKKKTFIKEGAFQKVPNTAGANIKGALNLNKEVLDTLVDKDVLGTPDCCQYFPRVPGVLASQVTEDFLLTLPIGSLFMIEEEDGDFIGLFMTIQVDGVKSYVTINVT